MMDILYHRNPSERLKLIYLGEKFLHMSWDHNLRAQLERPVVQRAAQAQHFQSNILVN